MKTLYRYISYELLKLVLISFLLFLFVILVDRASTIAETVLGQGVSFFEFLSVLMKGLPAFFGIVIPISFVISVIVLFVQMENNNELVALKSCGVSVKQISLPVFISGVVFSLFSFYSLMFLAPKSNVAMKKELEELLKKKITMSITPKNFSSNFPGVTFYVEKVFPQKGLIENFMVSLQKRSELLTIFGKKGTLRTAGDTVFLDIYNGSAQLINWKKPEEFKLLNFKDYTVELYRFSKKEKFSAEKYKTLFQLIKDRSVEGKTELLKRVCLSLSPLIVGILAFSVAVSLPRGSMGAGIAFGLLLIVVYYVIYTVSKKLAVKMGAPSVALLPDVLFGILSAAGYYGAVKEKISFNTGLRW